MADSYMGQFLLVDLNRETTCTTPVPQWLKKQFVGGKGFGAKLLYDLVPQGTDPLSPENVLMFFPGPLTATAAPSMRACAVTKSPLTGTYLDSFFGGRLGPEIKYAGYDGILIFGRASKPVYLWIHDAKVEIRPADTVWGTSTLEANALIKSEINEPEAMLATIGQAGENQVLFALICCEYNRQAGRGGAGAVMGSKNLKAIAIKGSRVVRVHDMQAFDTACKTAYEEIAQSVECATYTDAGTSSAIPWSNEVGTLPYKNYYTQSDPLADKIGDEGQKKHLFLGKAACFGCPIRCSQMGAVRTGKYSHFITDIVEYESAALLGSNLDIHDPRAVAHLTKLCDEYGLDSMSAGGVIGFAFEAVENGIIQPPEGVTLAFGNVQGAEYIIKCMAFLKNDLGRLLSQGVKRASAILGKQTMDYAMHVKGLECPAWGPRGTPGMGLAYMTADRGGCHQRGFMIGYDVGGDEYNGQPVEPYQTKGRAGILIELQNFIAGTDALVKCDFSTCGVSTESFAAMLSTATGRQIDEDYFDLLGERIWNQTRLFNVREGFLAKDDTLPRRFVKKVLPDGPHKGQRVSEADMEYMRRDYYRIRGWDEQGRPTKQTLNRLGLDNARVFKERP